MQASPSSQVLEPHAPFSWAWTSDVLVVEVVVVLARDILVVVVEVVVAGA